MRNTTKILAAAVLTGLLIAGCNSGDQVAPAAQGTAAAPAPNATKPLPALDVPNGVEYPADAVATTDRAPMLIGDGASLGMKLDGVKAGTVKSAAVQIGNFKNTSDGKLKIKVCQADKCSEAEGDLSQSVDNRQFVLPLSAPVEIKEGQPVDVTVTRVGGTKPLAIWGYASETKATMANGKPGDRALRIGLIY